MTPNDIVAIIQTMDDDKMDKMIFMQVSDGRNGHCFNVGGDAQILNNGHLHIHMTHSDLRIDSYKVPIDVDRGVQDGYLKLPTSIHEAKSMMAIASMYLEQNKEKDNG